MGLREGDPLLVQTARLLHDGFGVAQQDAVACQAEDEIDQVPMRPHSIEFSGGEVQACTDSPPKSGFVG